MPSATPTSDGQHLLIETALSDRVLAEVPGAVTAPSGLVQVPWTQLVVEQLSAMRAPYVAPILRDYDWPGQYDPFNHQFATSAALSGTARFFCLNGLGCVDADTEYLSPAGWRRIADYDGGHVAQYHPTTRRAEFVQPLEYIAKPCDTMYHFKSGRGVDQMLSPEHRVLYHQEVGGAVTVRTAAQVATMHANSQRGFRGRFPVCYDLHRDSRLGESDALIRVQIAAIADGHFLSENGTRCCVRVLKEHKKDRLRVLLRDAGIEYSESSPDYDPGYTRFTFYAPVREKSFTSRWYAASNAQLRVIAEEVMHWDGSVGAGKREATFSTRVHESAVFVQYALVSTGRSATISGTVRKRERDAGTRDYTVTTRVGRSAASSTVVGMSCSGNPALKEKTVTEVTAPGGMKYCFSVPSTFLVFRRNGHVFCSGNSGKTISALWALDYLMSIGRVKRALIVAPLSILKATWLEAITAHLPHRSAVILHGGADVRRRKARTRSDFLITNYTGVEVCYDELMEDPPDAVVIDEADNLKNYTTRRWRYHNPICQKARYLWLMTGTPSVQYPLDAYGQIRLMYPNWPVSETAFKERTMVQVGKHRWIPSEDARDFIVECMQPAISVKTRDVIDMPPLTFSRRDVALTPEQKKAMADLRKEAVAIIASGQTVTAVHAAPLRTKLVQIASGIVYDDDRNEVEIDFKPRMDELIDIVRQARGGVDRRDPKVGSKVIVMCSFKHTAARVTAQLKAAGYNFATMTGEVSLGRRSDIVAEFQNSHALDGVVAIPDVMSHGLNLTAAATTIWFTPVDKAGVFIQANARMARPGQWQPMQIIKLCGCGPESVMYDRLDAREGFHHDVVDSYSMLIESM